VLKSSFLILIVVVSLIVSIASYNSFLVVSNLTLASTVRFSFYSYSDISSIWLFKSAIEPFANVFSNSFYCLICLVI